MPSAIPAPRPQAAVPSTDQASIEMARVAREQIKAPAVTETAPLELSKEVMIANGIANMPKPLLSVSAPISNSLFTVAVDKTNRTAYVLEETRENYGIIKTYSTSLGSSNGDKFVEEDKKTPEGVYTIIRRRTSDDLPNTDQGHLF